MARLLVCLGATCTLLCACDGAASGAQNAPAALDAGAPAQTARVIATAVDTHFVAREAFLAGSEMQISGEPLAQAMGRDLSAYSRDHLPSDIYFDPAGPWIDLPGFSSAVESYEYSKQAMNSVAFELGAGTSLAFAPLVNPKGKTGADALALLAGKLQQFGKSSHAFGRFVFAPGTFPANNARGGDANPLGKGIAAQNPLGWPGIWPTLHVFRSFDPASNPSSDVDLGCAISSDDDPGASGSLGCADYECDATSLHLTERAAQIEATITPGTDGFSTWKYGLWVLNYLQTMHDAHEAAVSSVDEGELAQVGSADNAVVGADASGMPTAAGTYLGSSDIEGFQAALFIEEVQNRAQDWLLHLTTSDGATLSGFASLKDALHYGYADAPRWFPAEVHVSEHDDPSGFPEPSYALGSPDSHLLDQLGMILGFAEFYALTDGENGDVGGSQPVRAYFDGDPFAADDPQVEGDASLHDRALAVLRVALVNLDRLHADPESGALVDDVQMNGTAAVRGKRVATTDIAYAIIALRTALRSLSSQLELYSNNTPDTALGRTPLEAAPTAPPDGMSGIAARMQALLRAQSDLLLERLTDDSGHAFDGWDLAQSAPLDDQDLLDSHTAAVRGLFAAYLATGDVRYRERAVAVFNRLQSVFYDPRVRIYTAQPAPADQVEYTPERFALLQSALRDAYELVATRPGGEALEPLLEERIARLNKLVLNGWDDRNQNRLVDWPDECVNVQDGLPRGGLQMAERTLTGETGSLEEQLQPGQMRTATADRERDCVPEIDDAHLPATLAASVTFEIDRP